MKRFTLFILFSIMPLALYSQDTLRVTTWNSLKFPNVNPQNRIPAFRKVLKAISPDILIVQELTSESGVDYFLDDILNYDTPGAYKSAPYTDGPDTDNMLFYKSLKLSLMANRQIGTGLRDVNEYVLTPKINPDRPELWFYAAHLKAGSTDRDSTYRKRDAETIREELDQRGPDTNFMLMGDFNLYNSSEPAWKILTGESDDNDGRCYDPINKPGWWHNSRTFSKYHTQSTRLTSVDDGASGGLDDRFDFILVSSSLMDSSGWYCDPASYQAYGNDGRHFNSYNINDYTNFAVPDSIADALYLASDHLPVVTDLVYVAPSTSVAQGGPIVPQKFDVQPAYPNPFNGSTVLSYSVGVRNHIRAEVYNIQGQLIEVLLSQDHSPGEYTLHWTPKGLSSGVYFIRWQGENITKIHKVLYIM